ncbi:hypothetical protein CWI38_0149p0020 [Hamiltosporidium tvaerminnensis]|uniref:Uncharacterized protein n=1 Tax=Hamiltosporidium tvaerminnensis TaxID=1176355 RepID=A0A4Q9M3C4_9MICR|nr:hypothetical protein CWI38_0149p0020 [Hamiltosporidium tvaerminnensis]
MCFESSLWHNKRSVKQIEKAVFCYYQDRNKTVQIYFADRRRGLEPGPNSEEGFEKGAMDAIKRSEMHEQPAHRSNQASN